MLPPVWDRMVVGRGEFLAELRPAVPIFVKFGGLDFDEDPAAPSILDEFVTRAQLALDEQGGSVLQLTIGDKGAYLYAVFGAPVAHEDDAARACQAALGLLEIGADVPVADVQVGIASGRLRSGTYGHAERRTFCCLGEAVNLAARLMTRAPAGSVLVHEDIAVAAGDRFVWDEPEEITVKGRARPVPVRALRARSAGHRPDAMTGASNALVGRDAELAQLRDLRATAEGGRGQVVVVQAEAGTGKSRLVAELVGELVTDGVLVATGEASPIASQAATYTAWREIWTDLLGLDVEGDADAVVVAVGDARRGARGPRAAARSVLGIACPTAT